MGGAKIPEEDESCDNARASGVVLSVVLFSGPACGAFHIGIAISVIPVRAPLASGGR